MRPGALLAVHDGEEAPPSRNSLEHPAAAILELDPGADDELHHGAGDKDFIGSRKIGNSCADMYRKPRHIVVADLDLARVEASANWQVELPSTDR